MAKHTKGPWLDWETLKWRHEPRKLLESTENALLIGAAPELLAVLERLLKISKTDDWNGGFKLDDALEDARAIVAKAKGKS